ncbi:MAG: acyl-CoA reductase [Cyclobacteriaceae bacterium]
MTLEERIEAFAKLGDQIKNLTTDSINEYARIAQLHNKWFTEDNVKHAFDGIALMLERRELEEWLKKYKIAQLDVPKIVGLIMAGNIPLVGFHDLLCVLLTGHFAAIKTSSQDEFLMRQVIEWLMTIEPRFKKNIEVRERLTSVDVLIATGSDNTARYLEYYFRDHPKVIRKNRTSIAVFNGTETDEDYQELAKDLFWYFGLGCRNVSKILTPENFNHSKFFESIEYMSDIGNHNKYRNNYDYHKSILLVNGEKHLDNGFLLLQPSEELVSPVSILFHQTYSSQAELTQYLNDHQDKIQCVVGKDYIPFGQAQLPKVWDYADGVDTVEFLISL